MQACDKQHRLMTEACIRCACLCVQVRARSPGAPSTNLQSTFAQRSSAVQELRSRQAQCPLTKQCSIVTKHLCVTALLCYYALHTGLALLESLALLITSDVYVLQELLKQRNIKYPCYIGVFVTYAWYGVLCLTALFRYYN
jgi:hypothetical protein